MYSLSCNVVFGDPADPIGGFSNVNEIVIKETLNISFANIATITVPYFHRKWIKGIKPGDKVEITLAYLKHEHNSKVEFSGFVTAIEPNTPALIHCEDDFYLFKRTNLRNTFRTASFKEVVNYIVDEVNLKYSTNYTIKGTFPEIEFKGYRLSNINAYAALAQIKENYGVNFIFKRGQLYASFGILEDFGNVKYTFGKNVISRDIKVVTESDNPIKLVAKSINNKNEVKRVEVGDPNGNVVTRIFYNIENDEQLLEIANRELSKYTYEGVEGSLKGFLLPFAETGMTAKYADSQFGIDGEFVITRVDRIFGQKGARRIVELGTRISA